MNILVITDSPSPYKVTFLEMMAQYHSIDIVFQAHSYKHRDQNWFKSTDKLSCTYLDDSIYKRIKEILSVDVKKYDLFWNMNYTSWECMITAIRFRLNNKLALMHADGGIYKDFGFLINKVIEWAMKLNHYFTSSGKLTTQYYLGHNIDRNKIFNYTFSSMLEKDIPLFNEYKKDYISGTFKILSVGQQIHRKGYDLLLKAIKDIDNIEVTIIGGQPNEECEQLMNEFNLYSKVKFISFVSFDELKQYYLRNDLFVLPTREDIWGLVMNEAMVFGLPLISTKKCVAAMEFEDKYKNCICVDVDDVNSLRNAITRLIEDENLRNTMKHNSIHYANEVTIDCMVSDYLNIFKKLSEYK